MRQEAAEEINFKADLSQAESRGMGKDGQVGISEEK